MLDEFEHVTCMKVLPLQSDMMGTGLKNFLVVGTSYNFGEDLACKGRVRFCTICFSNCCLQR